MNWNHHGTAAVGLSNSSHQYCLGSTENTVSQALSQTWKYWEALAGKKHSPAHHREPWL